MTPRRAGRSWLIAAVVVALTAMPAAALASAPLVITQVPAGEAQAGGGRIVLATPGGASRILTSEFADAADPDVSFDGRNIVFAGRKTMDAPWCVYERDLQSDTTRLITCGPAGARHPIYLPPVYTLTPASTETWELIAFVGTVVGARNDLEDAALTSLYSCKLDGSAMAPLTFSLSGDLDPVVLHDGRIVYSTGRRDGSGRKAGRALWGINLDGTDALVFAEAEGRPVKRSPAPTADGWVVFIESDAAAGSGEGTLGAVDLRRNLHSYRPLSSAAAGEFRAPSEDPEGGVLVSWRPSAAGETWDVYHFDPLTRRKSRLFHEARWESVEARRVTARHRPDGRSSVVKTDDPLATLYGLDVGISDLPTSEWSRSLARRVRVLEGVSARSGNASVVRRLLGDVALDEDGSFHLQVPADTPLEVQLLDEDGLSLRRSTWIWARRHEERGCIGCHEDRERTPPNRFVRAIQHPANVMNPPAAERRTVDFRHDVAPIVLARCLPCHSSTGSPPHLDGASSEAAPSRDYRTLLDHAVDAGQARTSSLIAHVLGRAAGRPWDKAAVPVKPIPEASTLTPADTRTLIEWIDWGAAWDSRSTLDAPSAGVGGAR